MHYSLLNIEGTLNGTFIYKLLRISLSEISFTYENSGFSSLRYLFDFKPKYTKDIIQELSNSLFEILLCNKN